MIILSVVGIEDAGAADDRDGDDSDKVGRG